MSKQAIYQALDMMLDDIDKLTEMTEKDYVKDAAYRKVNDAAYDLRAARLILYNELYGEDNEE